MKALLKYRFISLNKLWLFIIIYLIFMQNVLNIEIFYTIIIIIIILHKSYIASSVILRRLH